MKLGGFGFVKDYPLIKEAGFDYAELDMPELESMSVEDFAAFKAKTQEIGLPLPTGARILPIVEPTFFVDGFKPESLKDYLQRTCSRAAELGIKKVILGNGKARALPTPESIKNEGVFIDFLRMLADISADNGQELILEPLGPKYSNYLNTVPQAVELIKKAGRDNIFTMADLRHMVWSDEDLADLSEYVQYIHHVHIDYPLSFPERRWPEPGCDYNYADFIAALKASGYDGTLTVEADVPDDWNAACRSAREVLKELF